MPPRWAHYNDNGRWPQQSSNAIYGEFYNTHKKIPSHSHTPLDLATVVLPTPQGHNAQHNNCGLERINIYSMGMRPIKRS